MPLRTVSRSQYLASDAFLRTRDNPVVSDLLPSPDLNLVAASVRSVDNHHGLVLMQLDNVLSSQECNQVVDLNNASSFIAMKGRYEESKRRGSRLLAIDEKLSSLVWNRIQECINTTVDKEGISTTPLGFGVSTGSWSLDGTNAALRINRFTQKDGLFAPHVDAQYCPHADRRSLLSVVVYLTDDFDGGETKFYFPKHPTTLESASNLKGLTVDEEIKHRGGLQDGYDCIVVKPRRGSAVVFSQNLLHEGTPLRPQVGNDNVKLLRAILRMDVMVRRDKEWKGFAISEAETEDYQACLTYFREAQSQELEGNVAKAGELYERSLSIRYSYPNVLGLYLTAKRLPCRLNRLPSELLPRISLFLKEVDIQKMVLAFPSLLWLLETYQLSLKLLRRSEESKELSSIQWLELPNWAQYCGPGTILRFPSAAFFKSNADGCCRVAAVIAFFRLGHMADSDVYTVSYNPVTQEALAIEFEDVLLSAFYGKPCYGSIFKEKQQDSAERNPAVDFNASVDRTYMTYRFGSQFVGEGYLDNFYNRVTCHIPPSESPTGDEEVDSKAETDDSDDDERVSDADDYISYDKVDDVSQRDHIAVLKPDVGETSSDADTPDFNGKVDYDTGRNYSDAYKIPPQTEPYGLGESTGRYVPVCDHKFARKSIAQVSNTAENVMDTIKSKYTEDPTSYLQSVTSLNSGEREFARIGEVNHRVEACKCAWRTRVFHPGEITGDESKYLEFMDYPDDDITGAWRLVEKYPLSHNANDMVFDFSRYQLEVIEEESFEVFKPESCRACRTNDDAALGLWTHFLNAADKEDWNSRDDRTDVMRFKVDVTPLQQSDRFESFNHASHQCYYFPHLKMEMMDCLTYTHLKHVHLRCFDDLKGGMIVYATYSGIVAI